MILVSACLLGVDCRYDGENSLNEEVIETLHNTEERFIPICPEQLGGLPTPRKPTHLSKEGDKILDGEGKAIMSDGSDVTSNFRKGAEEVLKLARKFNADRAILKSGSPSCGVHKFRKNDEKVCGGMGVAAALLARKGIDVMDEKEI